MGKVTNRDSIIATLRKSNPAARLDKLVMYADAAMEYNAAQANIAEHGAIVFHPRTGAPIDNPYLRVRNTAAATMLKIGIKCDDVWAGVK